jgi:hypothetical protein
MNSVEITRALVKDEKVRDVLVGVFPADLLPEKEYPGFYIVNTESSDKSGEHWVAFYTSKPGRIEGFDSYGRNPTKYSDFIREWVADDYMVMSGTLRQGQTSTTCGQYCMFFVLLRAHGYRYEDIMSALTANPVVNDKFVCKFINKYFSLKTTTHNSEFLIQTLLKGIKELKHRSSITV